MSMSLSYAATAVAALVLGSGACNSGVRGGEESAAAPLDTTRSDAAAAHVDTTTADEVGTAVAPPSRAPRDTPPAGAAQPNTQGAPGGAPKVSAVEYEGWRQYSVNCARCHGQDVLPNPVAANLLISLAPGGPMAAYEQFAQVVQEGRPERGMPAFKSILTPEQIKAIYAYVKGRAEKRIPPGRPASPSA
ncbi:MAG TPA: cytochrome c [Gemmatimonadales bacterium]|nr:cytochrome c [Gemmatimonadales bacterium]